MRELVEPLEVWVVEGRDGERVEVEEVCVRRVALREDEVLGGNSIGFFDCPKLGMGTQILLLGA